MNRTRQNNIIKFMSIIIMIPIIIIIYYSNQDKPNTEQQIDNVSDDKNICSAEKIRTANLVYIPIVDLRSKLQEKEFRKIVIEYFKNDPSCLESNAVLYNEKGCYFSACGAAIYNVNTNTFEKTLQCFIFTHDLEEVGTIYFYLYGKKTLSQISINSAENGTKSALLKKLSKNKDKEYVIISDGYYSTALLDSDNTLIPLSTGSDVFVVNGDCFSELNNTGVSLSYNKIINEKNLIWIEFD